MTTDVGDPDPVHSVTIEGDVIFGMEDEDLGKHFRRQLRDERETISSRLELANLFFVFADFSVNVLSLASIRVCSWRRSG
jgi:hypothetical protein